MTIHSIQGIDFIHGHAYSIHFRSAINQVSDDGIDGHLEPPFFGVTTTSVTSRLRWLRRVLAVPSITKSPNCPCRNSLEYERDIPPPGAHTGRETLNCTVLAEVYPAILRMTVYGSAAYGRFRPRHLGSKARSDFLFPANAPGFG